MSGSAVWERRGALFDAPVALNLLMRQEFRRIGGLPKCSGDILVHGAFVAVQLRRVVAAPATIAAAVPRCTRMSELLELLDVKLAQAQVEVDGKSNEIPAMTLLPPSASAPSCARGSSTFCRPAGPSFRNSRENVSWLASRS